MHGYNTSLPLIPTHRPAARGLPATPTHPQPNPQLHIPFPTRNRTPHTVHAHTLQTTRSHHRTRLSITQTRPTPHPTPPHTSPQMLVSEMAYPPGGRDGKSKRAFYSTPEDNYGNLAQYYDIPSISFRWVQGLGFGVWWVEV